MPHGRVGSGVEKSGWENGPDAAWASAVNRARSRSLAPDVTLWLRTNGSCTQTGEICNNRQTQTSLSPWPLWQHVAI